MIDFDHHDHNVIALGHDVTDRVDRLFSEFVDWDETLLARHDLDERSEVHYSHYLAEDFSADFDLAREVLDHLHCTVRAFFRRATHRDCAVFFDVNTGTGLCLKSADHLPARANDGAYAVRRY